MRLYDNKMFQTENTIFKEDCGKSWVFQIEWGHLYPKRKEYKLMINVNLLGKTAIQKHLF
jgi:hypothetical protein